VLLAGVAGAWALGGGEERAEAQAEAVPDGATVYAVTCAACHGPAGAGRTGEGVEAGPALIGLDVAFVDMTLRTGRMPIEHRELGVVRDELDDDERVALVDWMQARMDLEGAIPDVPVGDRARGHELYGLHCSACHGATGQGGIQGEGQIIPPVEGLDRVAVAEAIRVGPFDMPGFSEYTIPDEDAAAIGTFVEEDLTNPPRTVAGIPEMHRITFWGLACVVAAALVAAVVLVATPVRRIEEPESASAGPGGGR
jgi:ubiquinol-cytochrome c reductase cytochrome c subunit